MVGTALQKIFWVASLAGEIALLVVLIRRKRWKDYPAFTALVASSTLVTLPLMLLQRSGAISWYTRVYWAYDVVNILIQLAVLAELARVVLRPTGTWVRDARKQFLLWGVAGGAVALALAQSVTPPAPSLVEKWALRADLFTSLLVCELFVIMASTSNRLGLGWRSHVVAIAQGLTAWTMTAAIVDAIHSYFGTRRFYVSLDYLTDCVYLAALGYWCVQLWREEPARQPISPGLRKYIVALHQRVHYDLGEAER